MRTPPARSARATSLGASKSTELLAPSRRWAGSSQVCMRSPSACMRTELPDKRALCHANADSSLGSSALRPSASVIERETSSSTSTCGWISSW